MRKMPKGSCIEMDMRLELPTTAAKHIQKITTINTH